MSNFSPERWLVNDETTGIWVYDATAGPVFPFGLGMRGCFGRKLAYYELRIVITLICVGLSWGSVQGSCRIMRRWLS
jgi:cytochrome P450